MKRVEGTLISFVDNPRQGIARMKDNKKNVFLPGACMRKELNGSWHHFAPGEERPKPTPNSKIVMDVTPDGKGFVANHWALA